MNSRARSPVGLALPPVEPAKAGTVLEVASLVLYGTCAIPVRLKILLDRLLGALPHDDVKQVLGAFGWTYDDYLRGYIAQVRLIESKGTLVNINLEEQYERFRLNDTRGNKRTHDWTSYYIHTIHEP